MTNHIIQMYINENFEIKTGTFKSKDGRDMAIAYIENSGDDDTFSIKDDLKNKFNARWLGAIKKWGWFVDKTKYQQLYDNIIVPCAKYLQSKEKGNQTLNTDDVQDSVDEPIPAVRTYLDIVGDLINQLQKGSFSDVGAETNSMSKDEIQRKLDEFYQELCSITSSQEFKEKLGPLIKWRNAQGHQFSLSNAILIWVQDPQATLVKSRSNWQKYYNRTVKPNAPALCIWVPIGGDTLTSYQKKLITNQFLAKYGYNSVQDLTPGLKEKLNVALKGTNNVARFELKPVVYDVRFTEQIPGEEDVVGNNNADNIPWFDESGEETTQSIQLYDAMCEIIKESGVSLDYKDDLGGARGVSKGGKIDVLRGIKRNQGAVSTLVHEFSHELLHQKYLKESHNGNEWATYFIGQAQGRAMVEQQAEVSAWIVLRFFGYDMPTSVNYAGIWGMDEKKVHVVFKSVANVASQIVNKLQEKLSTINGTNEAILREFVNNGQFRLTGYDLANMLNLDDMYMKSVRADEQVQECVNFAKRLMLY